MYNMEISVGSYKFRLEILILIVVVSWIMFGHILCGCCRVNLLEGMIAPLRRAAVVGTVRNNNQTTTEGMIAPIRRAAVVGTVRNNNQTTTEGFVGANNIAAGPEFSGANTPDYIMNPSTWTMPTLTYSPGSAPSAGVKAIWDRPKQPIPLPKDELDMFATTPFAPECCPNAYSSSTGCACMTVDQYSYLRDRGGNNVPYSEY